MLKSMLIIPNNFVCKKYFVFRSTEIERYKSAGIYQIVATLTEAGGSITFRREIQNIVNSISSKE
jgi:hypothetical protein